MIFRIGILGIYHESNTFLQTATEWEDFEKGHLLLGKEIVDEYRTAYHEIGGVVEVLSNQADVDMIPIFYAEATPGGKISSLASGKLLGNLKELLAKAGPLDGLMVLPHGAAVSEDYPDFDGKWLRMVRELLGEDIPIVGTLDPHCNLSEEMAASANAWIAYKTNPHIDQRKTGRDAALLLLGMLRGEIRPVMTALQTQVAISIEMQHTASEPCLGLYRLADEVAALPSVLSVSVLLGFPYADVAEMGSSFIVVTDHNPSEAARLAGRLKSYLETYHHLFSGKKIGLPELPALIEKAEKPLLLLDMGDNVGGGSPGDSTFLLAFLEESDFGRGFMCIYDPNVVDQFSRVRVGDSLTVEIGGKTDRLHGSSVAVTAELGAMVDGKFFEFEPRHGGQVSFDMGLTAIVQTTQNNTLMLTSRRIVPFSLQQLLAFGLDPNSYQVIVAKGVHAPLAAYMSVCKDLIRVNTPGATTADMSSLRYSNRRKPLFPFEQIG
ncbi:MAG: M81 family metallopeptidase [Lunatimonas sp.]|uniref:M81 family metallopeptidase n=1 Tax=Lunatimonas sp. TaxID=2060141 RepID=UPI00263AE86B|nr:M81 family metallopeptidase [Lunatimonas sp.]MCC5939210.1 M81 family metallopeptidase [Lunatimonas sp.]